MTYDLCEVLYRGHVFQAGLRTDDSKKDLAVSFNFSSLSRSTLFNQQNNNKNPVCFSGDFC